MKIFKSNLLYVTILVFSIFFTSCSKHELIGPCIDHTSTPEAQKKVISQVYPLDEVNSSGMSGTATFQKIGDKTKIIIQLDGTMAGNMHPSHIHFNDVATGGGIAVSLSDINGASGRSITIVSMMDNGTPITYEQLLTFDGYINVHLSATQLSTITAQGNIGSNF